MRDDSGARDEEQTKAVGDQPGESSPGGARPESRPATYREVFAVHEYSYLFWAFVLSQLGDQLAKVALAFLVFDRTNSPFLAAVTYAVSYIPWVIGGPLLSAYVDRLPRRGIMVFCDAIRAVLIGSLAIPGLPIGVLIGLLFVANLFSAPFTSARAATVPDVLDGDKYVVGNGLDNIVAQLSQVIGFGAGGFLIAVLTAQGSVLIDAGTFVVSGLLILVGVKRRPPASEGGHRMSPGELVRDSTQGAVYIFTHHKPRSYLLVYMLTGAFAFSVEGVALPLAVQFGGGAGTQGLILAASPVGVAAGAFLIGRLCPPDLRIRLIIPLALGSLLVLVPVVVAPSTAVILVLLVLMGFGTSFSVPLNPLFARAIPASHRGRAFAVAVAGLNVTQGLGYALAGLAAEVIDPDMVVAFSGVLGLLVVIPFIRSWPHPILGLRRAAPMPAEPEEAAA